MMQIQLQEGGMHPVRAVNCWSYMMSVHSPQHYYGVEIIITADNTACLYRNSFQYFRGCDMMPLYGYRGDKEVWIRSFCCGTFELFHVPCRCDEVGDPDPAVQLQLLYVHVVLCGTYQLSFIVRPIVQSINAFQVLSTPCIRSIIIFVVDLKLFHVYIDYDKNEIEFLVVWGNWHSSTSKKTVSELYISSWGETIPEYKTEKLTYY